MIGERTMLSFVKGQSRFNYRVAGIALRDGHVLVCREDDDPYVLLPGGRVEFGEQSDEALLREIAEELGHAASLGSLTFTAENFFVRDGQDFHELAVYYRVDLPVHFPFSGPGECLVTRDEGHDLRFSWVALDGSALAGANLLPRWLQRRLLDLPDGHEHVKIIEM